MQNIIYSICLVIHITGLTLMVGATFMDYTIFRQFWNAWSVDKVKGMAIGTVLYRLQRYMGIGMLPIILSGVGMMAYLHQVWGQQTWFRLKMALLLLVIINGLAIRRRLGNSLKGMLDKNPSTIDTEEKKLVALKKNMNLVHIFQLLFFLLIFVLSVFKFNA